MENFEQDQFAAGLPSPEIVDESPELFVTQDLVHLSEETFVEDPQEVADQIESLRRQLGISDEEEKTEDTEALAGKQITREGKEHVMQVNDLIVADDDTDRIRSVLSEHNIPASVKSYTQRVYAENGHSWTPGEDVLTVFDPESGDAASFAYTKQVRELLDANQIAARHGKMGAQSTEETQA